MEDDCPPGGVRPEEEDLQGRLNDEQYIWKMTVDTSSMQKKKNSEFGYK